MQVETSGHEGLLAVRNVEVSYGEGAKALRAVSLDVPGSAIVALLGANGAGKTTLLRAITGLLPMRGGRMSGGEIRFDGERIDRLRAPAIVGRGISQVLEGRRIWPEMTVEENLRAAAHTVRRKPVVRERLAEVFELFPRLVERRQAAAGYLSGGEQQMLAVGRALMQSPRLLLLDEPSLGLAPLIVQQLRDAIVRIKESGTTVLLVEQNAAMALQISDAGYVLRTGQVVQQAKASTLLEDTEIQSFYLGMGRGGEGSPSELEGSASS